MKRKPTSLETGIHSPFSAGGGTALSHQAGYKPGQIWQCQPGFPKSPPGLCQSKKINHRSLKCCSQPSQSEMLVHLSKQLCPLPPANFQRWLQYLEAHTWYLLLIGTLSLFGIKLSFSAEWRCFVLSVLSPHTPDGDNVPLGGFWSRGQERKDWK